jgi:hypothetical protein
MWCLKYNHDVGECTCPDINERLARAFSSDQVIAKWCRKCDKHYARCRCESPEWTTKGGEPRGGGE